MAIKPPDTREKMDKCKETMTVLNDLLTKLNEDELRKLAWAFAANIEPFTIDMVMKRFDGSVVGLHQCGGGIVKETGFAKINSR